MASASSDSSSQPVALSKTVQTLIDDIKKLGRIPKQNAGISAADRAANKLAKRFSDHKHKIPNEILQQLQALDSAPQHVELSDSVEALVEEVRVLGRIPRRNRGTSEDEKAENKLADRSGKNKKEIPKEILQELQGLSGTPQTVGQKILDDVKRLGHFPRRFSKPETEDEREEYKLAKSIDNALSAKRLSADELTELDELKRISIHPRDVARSAQLLEQA